MQYHSLLGNHNIIHKIFSINMCRLLSNYTTSYYTLVLYDVVHLCQFEGSLECIYMGFFSLFIHSGFGDGSGSADRISMLWIPYYTFWTQSLFEWPLCTVLADTFVIWYLPSASDICHLPSASCVPSVHLDLC